MESKTPNSEKNLFKYKYVNEMEHEETIHLRLISELHTMCIHKETNRCTNKHIHFATHTRS